MMLSAFLRPETARVVLLVLVGACYLAYHLRRAGRCWKGRELSTPDPEPTPTPEPTPAPVSEPAIVSVPAAVAEAVPPNLEPEDPHEYAPGEEAFLKAMAVPHGVVPTYLTDRDHLFLLGTSARCGYPPALALLGDYAKSRKMWVEAYYWTWRAHRAGLAGLERNLQSLRTNWQRTGASAEEENVYPLFTEQDASVARALLDIATGRSVDLAREYLRENYPEFLDGGGGMK